MIVTEAAPFLGYHHGGVYAWERVPSRGVQKVHAKIVRVCSRHGLPLQNGAEIFLADKNKKLTIHT